MNPKNWEGVNLFQIGQYFFHLLLHLIAHLFSFFFRFWLLIFSVFSGSALPDQMIRSRWSSDVNDICQSINRLKMSKKENVANAWFEFDIHQRKNKNKSEILLKLNQIFDQVTSKVSSDREMKMMMIEDDEESTCDLFLGYSKKKTYQQYFHISGLFSFVCFCCCLLAIWKTKQNKIVTQDALFWLSKDNGKDDDDDFDDDNVFFVWLFFSCKEIKCRSIYIFVLLLFSVFAEWIFGWLNGWMDVFPRLNTVFTKIMVWLFF